MCIRTWARSTSQRMGEEGVGVAGRAGGRAAPVGVEARQRRRWLRQGSRRRRSVPLATFPYVLAFIRFGRILDAPRNHVLQEGCTALHDHPAYSPTAPP